MKNQINRFARGAFEYSPPILEVLENNISEAVERNKEFSGTINIIEKEGRELKGIIYSDNEKVTLKNSTFSGSKVSVRYTVNSKGTISGDVIEGAFHIVSDGGEKAVYFSFRVEADSFDTSIGAICELSQAA